MDFLSAMVSTKYSKAYIAFEYLIYVVLQFLLLYNIPRRHPSIRKSPHLNIAKELPHRSRLARRNIEVVLVQYHHATLVKALPEVGQHCADDFMLARIQEHDLELQVAVFFKESLKLLGDVQLVHLQDVVQTLAFHQFFNPLIGFGVAAGRNVFVGLGGLVALEPVEAMHLGHGIGLKVLYQLGEEE